VTPSLDRFVRPTLVDVARVPVLVRWVARGRNGYDTVMASNKISATLAGRTDLVWRVVSGATGLVAGMATRRLLAVAWSSLSPSDHEPPLNPADRRITWPEAVTWAVAAGAGVGVAHLVGQRLAAAGWELATGEAPPGIDDGA
jgi:hypothetical protein